MAVKRNKLIFFFYLCTLGLVSYYKHCFVSPCDYFAFETDNLDRCFIIVIIDFWIRGSTQLHWELASRNLNSEGVYVEPCDITGNCSKLVIRNLKYTDTGYYTCSYKNSREHESSIYVFVKGKL